MNNIYKALIITTLSCLIVSCSSTKKLPIVVSEPIPTKSRAIVKNTIKNEVGLSTYTSKLKVTLKTEDLKKKLKGTLRIQKDKVIWLSLRKTGIEFSRIMFTPDSVFMINYIDKTYLKYDYKKLNKKLSSSMLNYHNIESLLLNKFFFQNNVKLSNKLFERESLQVSGNKNVVEVKSGDVSVFQYFVILTDIYKIHKNHIEDKSNGVNLSISYDKFMTVSDKEAPTQMFINLKTKNKSIQSDVKISKIIFDKELKFPFKAPKKYKRITN